MSKYWRRCFMSSFVRGHLLRKRLKVKVIYFASKSKCGQNCPITWSWWCQAFTLASVTVNRNPAYLHTVSSVVTFWSCFYSMHVFIHVTDPTGSVKARNKVPGRIISKGLKPRCYSRALFRMWVLFWMSRMEDTISPLVCMCMYMYVSVIWANG